jgi:hypothetical protein
MERIKQTNGRPPPPALNSGTVFLLHSLHLVLLVNCYQMAIFSYFPIDSRQSKISRVASLTKATEEAKERAAVAYQKAEEEKLERVRIEKAIIDELAQRDIKREQVEAISSAIKGKIGIIYLYPLSDPEASRYVFAISETLKRGGANPRLILSGTKELPVFPDKFNVAVSPIGVTVYESGGMHEVVDLLVRAFGEAGIKFQGQWSEKNLPGVVDGKWVEDASIQSPAIFVGLRPPPFSQFPGYASPPELDEFLKNHPPLGRRSDRSFCITHSHRSCCLKNASISSSGTNSSRFACASPSRTAARVSSSRWMIGVSSPAIDSSATAKAS